MLNSKSRQLVFKDLGIVRYQSAWDYQAEVFQNIIAQKIELRTSGELDIFPENILFFCEHPPVYTLGKSGNPKNLLYTESELRKHDIDYHHINRGGDITFHGPGQIVGYPIIDLDQFFTDIHKYLRFLEEAIILTLADYGIESGRIDGLTGVWVDGTIPERARKICAMGIKCSRWVTMHGFAFNVNTDLSYFDHIIPCGIDDKAVTSMEKELGHIVDIQEVAEKLKIHLGDLFGWQLIS